MLKRDIDKLLPALMLGPRYYHEVSGVQFGDLRLIALIPGRPMGSIVTVFGGTGFLGRRVVQHSIPCGSHRGIRIAAASNSVSRTRSSKPSKLTFTTSGQSPTRLLALTVW